MAKGWFGRQVSTRWIDYGWSYRRRLGSLRGRDPRLFATGNRRPVLILPGVYETWHFLEPVAEHLHDRGHPVHAVPTFGRNLRPIGEMAEIARDYLERTDLRDVAVIAHSKGGLIGKTLMISEGSRERVTTLVAINSPFGGSDYAHLVPLRALREFVPTHSTIVELAQSAEPNARITSIYSSWDPIIPNGSVLAGATNIELPVRGHFRILDRDDLFAVVDKVVADA
jgi:hypothetical protein